MKTRVYTSDQWFSRCVRYRVNYVCEYCGDDHSYSSEAKRTLHCSHLFSRRNQATRYHPWNAFAHCFTCHQQLGENPVLFAEWARAALGARRFKYVRELHLQTLKRTKADRSLIAKHYRETFIWMTSHRADGHVERLDFPDYDETYANV